MDTNLMGSRTLAPPAFMSRLNEVLNSRKQSQAAGGEDTEKNCHGGNVIEDKEDLRPIILVTNDDGIQAPGLKCLVEALVNGGRCNVNVCAPDHGVEEAHYCKKPSALYDYDAPFYLCF